MCKTYHPLTINDAAAQPAGEGAFTRRQFLHAGMAMVSTLATVPGFVSRSSMAMADTTMRTSSKAGVPEDRVLVVVQLSGGNDGLNTVVPYGADGYFKSRPGLKLDPKAILPLDETNGIGLHPALRPVHEMIGEGLASVVQGVGYPNPNRSHFASMDIWHTADPVAGETGGRGVGWIGAALDHDAKDLEGVGCVSIGAEAPLATLGQRVQPVTFERAELFRWAGRDLHPALGPAYEALQQGDASGDDATSFLFRTAMDAQVASDRIRKAVAQKPQTTFPNTGLGGQLRMVASMIKAELPTRVYYVAHGSFDTHANQAPQHERLLREFAQAMQAFYGELGATGHRSRVVTLAFSEFGRRVRQNASGGTDHGTAGPVFLFGEPVKPGLQGEHPSLERLEQGDLVHTMDFRRVYADVLDHWLRIDSRQALGKAFAPAGLLRV